MSTTAVALPTASSFRPRRRMWMLILSILAMVVCAGAFALIYLRADTRTQVLAVARPVSAGQTLAEADIRVVRVVPDDGIQLISANRSSHVIGRTAVAPLVPGSLLTETQIGPAAWPPSGQAIVAVPVKAGRLAAGVTAGVRVLVIGVTKDPDTRPAPSMSMAGRGGAGPVVATVVSVVTGIDGSGTSMVSLLVARHDAVTVAGSAGEVSIAVARD